MPNASKEMIILYRDLLQRGKLAPRDLPSMIAHLDTWEAWSDECDKNMRFLNKWYSMFLFPLVIYYEIKTSRLSKKMRIAQDLFINLNPPHESMKTN